MKTFRKLTLALAIGLVSIGSIGLAAPATATDLVPNLQTAAPNLQTAANDSAPNLQTGCSGIGVTTCKVCYTGGKCYCLPITSSACNP